MDKWKERTNIAIDLTVPISEKESKLLAIEFPCSQKLPLIPQITQAAPSNTIKIGRNGDVLHVGTKVFILPPHGPSSTYRQMNLDEDDGYFEESCRRGNFTALSRRRRLKKMSAEALQKEEERVAQRLKRRRDLDRQRGMEHESDNSDEDSEGPNHGRPSDDDLIVDKDQTNVTSEEELEGEEDYGHPSPPDSSDSESLAASEGSSCPSSFNSPIHSETDTNDEKSDLGSDSDEEGRDSDGERSISSLASETGGRFSDVDSVEEGKQVPSGAEDEDMFFYPVGIEPNLSSSILCDECDSEQHELWFRCAFCEPQNGYDLCAECVQEKGVWCYDKRYDKLLNKCSSRIKSG